MSQTRTPESRHADRRHAYSRGAQPDGREYVVKSHSRNSDFEDDRYRGARRRPRYQPSRRRSRYSDSLSSGSYSDGSSSDHSSRDRGYSSDSDYTRGRRRYRREREYDGADGRRDEERRYQRGDYGRNSREAYERDEYGRDRYDHHRDTRDRYRRDAYDRERYDKDKREQYGYDRDPVSTEDDRDRDRQKYHKSRRDGEYHDRDRKYNDRYDGDSYDRGLRRERHSRDGREGRRRGRYDDSRYGDDRRYTHRYESEFMDRDRYRGGDPPFRRDSEDPRDRDRGHESRSKEDRRLRRWEGSRKDASPSRDAEERERRRSASSPFANTAAQRRGTNGTPDLHKPAPQLRDMEEARRDDAEANGKQQYVGSEKKETFWQRRRRMREKAQCSPVWGRSPSPPRRLKDRFEVGADERKRKERKRQRKEERRVRREAKRAKRATRETEKDVEPEETSQTKRAENDENHPRKQLDSEDEEEQVVGPSLPPTKEKEKLDYGKALRPGEGSKMAAFVQDGARIPRRGEIGLTSDQISHFEDQGYVMSGSRNRRMEAVRLRKENQVYSAEELAALSQFSREENKVREERMMNHFKKLVESKRGETPAIRPRVSNDRAKQDG